VIGFLEWLPDLGVVSRGFRVVFRLLLLFSVCLGLFCTSVFLFGLLLLSSVILYLSFLLLLLLLLLLSVALTHSRGSVVLLLCVDSPHPHYLVFVAACCSRWAAESVVAR
jgi:hypothetical protein